MLDLPKILSMNILGLTGGFHFGSCDAAASIVQDGRLIAAVEEERCTRIKGSMSIPPNKCIQEALSVSGLGIKDIDYVALYVEGYPEAESEMRDQFLSIFGYCPDIKLINHHLCHAASAHYASGFDQSAVICVDWSGDGISTSIWRGTGDKLDLLESIKLPNSLGIFYAAMTQFLGFSRGDEYKIMGLAPYGNNIINLDSILDLSGPFYSLNPDIISKSCRNMNQSVFAPNLKSILPDLFRPSQAPLLQKHKDLALSIQTYYERAFLQIAKYAVEITGLTNLCIAGGCGLNCRANGLLLRQEWIKEVYVPPFPNDTGCSYGAACVVSHQNGISPQPLSTALLGPSYTDEEIKQELDVLNLKATKQSDVSGYIAEQIASGKIIGWFQGRLEIGPRALGARSILADPRQRDIKDRINSTIKFREDFRPFAPSVLKSESSRYFDSLSDSPYMSFTMNINDAQLFPGVTHVDGTSRVQTVSQPSLFHDLLYDFGVITGHPMLVNTSFNYMGQPIVSQPKDAIGTFFSTGLNTLALGSWVIEKD